MIPIPDGDLGAAIIARHFDTEDWEKELDNSATSTEKAICDYSGLSFFDIKKLSYVDYLLYRRESWLYNLKKSEDGRKFLKDLWRYQQTNADTVAINDYKAAKGVT
ncbi:hypothetical protein FFD13_12040 [Listeria monocytogenes]|uniref:hypothetical protein n=1 Tax=Listeria monocytogenes TaxID=1639 RepID=UPI0011F0D248|nr:hypothetical protein [Listeria monocytogenes]EAV9864766.1 hypothetical protein [Listeria monocytogenes]TYU25351.1 hypothetical protein FZW91_02390 [Listeria monocytogenes]